MSEHNQLGSIMQVGSNRPPDPTDFELGQIAFRVRAGVVPSVIHGVQEAVQQYGKTPHFYTDATLRARAINNCIIDEARLQMKRTGAQAEFVGNAWRWAVNDLGRLCFKLADASGLPSRNYSTKQSHRYVNDPLLDNSPEFNPEEGRFVWAPPMLTVLYTLKSTADEVQCIDLAWLRGKSRVAWSERMYESGLGVITNPNVQTTIPVTAPSVKVNVKRKPRADKGSE